MSDVIEVSINTLEQDAGYMEDHIDEVKKEIKHLYEIVEELNGMWSSVSKNIFVANLDKDRTELENLVKEAERITSKMRYAVEVYRKCENVVADEVNSINV